MSIFKWKTNDRVKKVRVEIKPLSFHGSSVTLEVKSYINDCRTHIEQNEVNIGLDETLTVIQDCFET